MRNLLALTIFVPFLVVSEYFLLMVLLFFQLLLHCNCLHPLHYLWNFSFLDVRFVVLVFAHTLTFLVLQLFHCAKFVGCLFMVIECNWTLMIRFWNRSFIVWNPFKLGYFQIKCCNFQTKILQDNSKSTKQLLKILEFKEAKTFPLRNWPIIPNGLKLC